MNWEVAPSVWVTSPAGSPSEGGGSRKVFASALLTFILAGKFICPIFRIPGQTGIFQALGTRSGLLRHQLSNHGLLRLYCVVQSKESRTQTTRPVPGGNPDPLNGAGGRAAA